MGGVMSCADGWDNRKWAKEVKECPDCGEDVDEDGDAVEGCNHSPVECATCGAAPCNDSC